MHNQSLRQSFTFYPLLFGLLALLTACKMSSINSGEDGSDLDAAAITQLGNLRVGLCSLDCGASKLDKGLQLNTRCNTSYIDVPRNLCTQGVQPKVRFEGLPETGRIGKCRLYCGSRAVNASVYTNEQSCRETDTKVKSMISTAICPGSGGKSVRFEPDDKVHVLIDKALLYECKDGVCAGRTPSGTEVAIQRQPVEAQNAIVPTNRQPSQTVLPNSQNVSTSSQPQDQDDNQQENTGVLPPSDTGLNTGLPANITPADATIKRAPVRATKPNVVAPSSHPDYRFCLGLTSRVACGTQGYRGSTRVCKYEGYSGQGYCIPVGTSLGLPDFSAP